MFRLICILSIIGFVLTFGDTLNLPFKSVEFKKPSLLNLKQRISRAMRFCLELLAEDVGTGAPSFQSFKSLIESAQSDQVDGTELSYKIFDSALMALQECKHANIAYFVSAFFLTPVLLRASTMDVARLSKLLCKQIDPNREMRRSEVFFVDLYFARFKLVNNSNLRDIWQRLQKHLSQAKINLKRPYLQRLLKRRFEAYNGCSLLDLDCDLTNQVDTLIEKIFKSAEISV